ncbi:unnamed protein product [Staurois parvus]|uniref:Uncharacterized protein n=1 Tax=Staurois parvus TaxID=386267 RepID=A0ABN9GJQ0_9NEOB|nr:unnamed protein product [Staurois parvus]
MKIKKLPGFIVKVYLKKLTLEADWLHAQPGVD